MAILVDKEIRDLCVDSSGRPGSRRHEKPMLEPFSEGIQGNDVISYGLSHAGYDLRLGDKVLVFKNTRNELIDPKKFKRDQAYWDRVFDTIYNIPTGEKVMVPPHSYILGYSMEYIRMPRDIKGTCVGKCLTGDTRVLNPITGEYKPITQFKNGENIAATHFSTSGQGESILPSPIKGDAIYNGKQVVYELTTKSGIRIKATANHPFMSERDGWTAVDCLAVGDKILCASHIPYFGTGEMSKAEVQLLALMIADGGCGRSSASPIYTKHDPRLVRMFKRSAKLHLDCETTVARPHHYRIVNQIGRGGTVTKNRAAVWLASHGIACKSAYKKIPDAIFTLPKAKIAHFLRVLFSGDGSVYLTNKKRKTPCIVVEYSSASKRLVEDIHHLMLRFGIWGHTRTKPVKGKDYYTYSIRRNADLARYFDQIGFVEGSFKDTFYKESVSRYIGDVLWADDAQMDEVVSIVRMPELEEVYDLEVPGPHNFMANGMIVHNSTLARCGIVINTTPLEPGWEGHLTLEIANVSPCPVVVYVGEGIAQLEFHKLTGDPLTDYAGKGGKYQKQEASPVPARVKE